MITLIKDYTEKTLTKEHIFNGKVIQVDVDTVELPNGKKATREIVYHPGAVGILAVTSENKIILVKQYRKPLNKVLLEIPAGKLEKDEEPLKCARRELEEETGYTATNMSQIGFFYTSPGFANEIIYLYKAEGLVSGTAKPDEDEFVELVELSFSEVEKLISSGEITDAKTLLALYYWQIEILKGMA